MYSLDRQIYVSLYKLLCMVCRCLCGHSSYFSDIPDCNRKSVCNPYIS